MNLRRLFETIIKTLTRILKLNSKKLIKFVLLIPDDIKRVQDRYS